MRFQTNIWDLGMQVRRNGMGYVSKKNFGINFALPNKMIGCGGGGNWLQLY